MSRSRYALASVTVAGVLAAAGMVSLTGANSRWHDLHLASKTVVGAPAQSAILSVTVGVALEIALVLIVSWWIAAYRETVARGGGRGDWSPWGTLWGFLLPVFDLGAPIYFALAMWRTAGHRRTTLIWTWWVCTLTAYALSPSRPQSSDALAFEHPALDFRHFTRLEAALAAIFWLAATATYVGLVRQLTGCLTTGPHHEDTVTNLDLSL